MRDVDCTVPWGQTAAPWRKLRLASAVIVCHLALMTGAGATIPDGVDAASRAFDDAQFRKDRAAIGSFLAPDMVYIRGSAERVGRNEFLDTFSDPGVKFDPFVIKDRELVALSDDVVAVTAEGTITGTEAGKPFRDHFRFSDIFRRRGGKWEVIYVQVSRFPPK